jgi:hypothetical protein
MADTQGLLKTEYTKSDSLSGASAAKVALGYLTRGAVLFEESAMKITTKNGYTFSIDDEDYEKIRLYTWSGITGGKKLKNGGIGTIQKYIVTCIKIEGKWKTVHLHRLILNASPKIDVDHKDGNGLNNHKQNLRLCSPSQNTANGVKHCNNTSGFKGVSWHKGKRKWEAQIQTGHKTKFLGRFDSPQKAALAYNIAAISTFGEFARLNEA